MGRGPIRSGSELINLSLLRAHGKDHALPEEAVKPLPVHCSSAHELWSSLVTLVGCEAIAQVCQALPPFTKEAVARFK
eukprot:5878627-Pleurochrysis_carterae.AAC.1